MRLQNLWKGSELNALNDSLATADTASDALKDLNQNIQNLSPLTTTYTDPVSAANLNEIRDVAVVDAERIFYRDNGEQESLHELR